ncbi:MAG: hypothetical protein BRD46_05445 [Bacteroidetes bacterium QS_8_68_15]|nr:MAG: hypothetical protein BRD46_05445 [Bacteroidetes bacterium QS_8_68_15]
MPRLTPLDVVADLSLVADGDDLRIRGDGRTVVVAAESLGALRRLLQNLPESRRTSAHLGRLHGALEEADLTVEVRAAGDRVARLGADAEAGAMSRLLRLRGLGVEVRAARPALTAARQRPGLALALTAAGVAGGAALLYLLFGQRD